MRMRVVNRVCLPCLFCALAASGAYIATLWFLGRMFQ